MRKKIRHAVNFTAHDECGNRYIIYIFTDINDAGTFSNPTATSEGLKHLRTADGDEVNYLEKGVYQIVSTRVVVRSNVQ